MLCKRIIPCLDIKDGRTVKGVNFVDLRDAGDPVELAIQYSKNGADELVFLDISATNEKRKTLTSLVYQIAENVNIPFTVGGGITSIDDISVLLENGADKVAMNSAAFKTPELINQAAHKFGSQCIVVAVDARFTEGNWKVYLNGGKLMTDRELMDWSIEAQSRGAGELLFTSMDHDGTKNGFANEMIAQLSTTLSIPVIASGGAGSKEDFLNVFINGKADAALAASVFHYGEILIPDLKRYLTDNKLPIRI